MDVILNNLRNKIDKIDTEILELLNKRAKHVKDIGNVKKKRGKPVFDGERENRIIQKIKDKNRGKLLPDDLIVNIFNGIIENSRKFEEDGG